MNAAAQKVNNRLSDGREIRSLIGKDGPLQVTQVQQFKLTESGLYAPQREGLMLVRDLDDALNVSNSFQSIRNNRRWWRSGEVGFYRMGFEINLTLQIGKKLVWVEREVDINGNKTGNVIAAVFNGPEEAARAIGMGVIPQSKLSFKQLDEVSLSSKSLATVLGSNAKGKEGKLLVYEVSLAADFNPATDLQFKNVARPRALHHK